MQLDDLKAKTRERLQRALKYVATAGLAAALVPLAATPASATFAVSATITGSVSTGPAPFTYAFTVNNSAASIAAVNAFELPLFSATDIVANSEVFPNGWSFQITPATSTNWTYNTADDAALAVMPGKYGPNPQVFNNPPTSPSLLLTFFFTGGTGGVAPNTALSGFGFTSNFTALDSPALAGFSGLNVLVPADPPMPNSPARMLADGAAAVPEPTSVILAGTAGVMLAAAWGYTRLRIKWAAGSPA